MITISLCMIVKNEEKNLPSCLRSLKGLVDEMIIVDTGSADDTKKIAKAFGAKVFDYQWIDDFADARNFAFSKAGCDYIYSADADETLDEENRERFRILKETLDPRIDMVQMYYCNQLKFKTVYNFDRELRPKLFKRLRTFLWEDPIHEQVRLSPVIFDSDIEIDHHPAESHAGRDLANFRKAVARGETLSKRLHGMYARELYMAGEKEDFAGAREFFTASCGDTARSLDEIREAALMAAKAALYAGDIPDFFKFAMKCVTAGEEPCSEICCTMGDYYAQAGDTDEAIVWYYNAAYETAPVLDAASGKRMPLKGLADCYRRLGNAEQAKIYEEEAEGV